MDRVSSLNEETPKFFVDAVVQGLGGTIPGEDLARTRSEAGSQTRGGSAEVTQRLGSGARPGSLEGRLSGTGGNHREWLERRRGEFVRILHPESVSILLHYVVLRCSPLFLFLFDDFTKLG